MQLDEAKQILLEKLGIHPYLEEIGDEYAINEANIEEKHYGWIIPFNSKVYLETGDIQHLLLGTGLAIVNKHNGMVHFLDSSESVVAQIEQYEANLD